MEQLFDLPKAIQKKVLEFQKKFRENSKSEAIHLEPINTFKDQMLRTARIDGKYRAIVKVPSTGDSYYLLWVDNHDEAMDWARNKIFNWNENTQTAQIFTAPEAEMVAPVTAAAKKHNLFAGLSDSNLISIGVPETSLNLVRSIKDLDELSKAEKYLPTDVFENLFYISEGANVELIIAEINEGKVKSANIDEQINSINNKRSFVQVSDELMADVINGELSKWQIFLHPSQRKLVETNFKGPVKVTGGAGTGKTVVALHRLKHLAAISEIGDERKIVFTTYTNPLTINLNALARKMGLDDNKYIITNIDTLAKEIALTAKLIDKNTRVLDLPNSKNSFELWDEVLEQNLSEFDTQFLSNEFQHVILYNNCQTLDDYLKVSRIGRGKPISRKQKMDIWKLVELYNQKKRQNGYLDRAELFNAITIHNNTKSRKLYRHVIADEIQDLSNVELRFLRSLVEEKENDMFLVGDPYQKIYARKLNFSSCGIAVRGTRSKQLRINYRTSEEIKRLAMSSIHGVSYDDFDGEAENLKGYLSLFHGEAPTYKVFKTKNEEIDAILSTIEDLKGHNFKFGDICIGCRTHDALKEIKSALHKHKIPYQDNTAAEGGNSVVLSTFHGLKGLEFKAVILADVNNRTSPLYFSKIDEMDLQEKADYLNSERSLIYVAVTRAVSLLKIFGTGVKSELVGLTK
ncbi:MAG: UvrD-helicase domain-containing protein [Bacteroidia bacterium]